MRPMPEPALKRTVTVANRAGLHVRAAVMIVTEARKFDARVVIAKGRHEVEATDVLQMMSLGAAQGEQLSLEGSGNEAQRLSTPSNNSSCGNSTRIEQTNRMQKLQGIAVSPGIAIGEALVMDNEGFRIPRRFVARDAVDDELDRLEKAIAAAAAEIAGYRDAIAQELGEKYAAIFDAHLQMLQDARLRSELEDMIRHRHYSPEYAVSRTLRRYAQVFQRLESAHLAERAADIFDIEKRLLRHLLGRRREGIAHLTSPVLVLAHNLTPSETANLDRRFIRGFVTEIGGPGSHTAIVAEALEIPAIVGTGPFLADVSGGELVIIDGDQGLVILQPDEETLAHYRHEVEENRSAAVRLEALRDLPATTADGVHVNLYGNIEFPYEVTHCVDRGAEGIGLYRTEFLYLGSEIEPTEEVHYRAYSQVVQAMGGKPVTIRTFDLGADKVPHLPPPEDERNPCLGLRSIRLALRHLTMFRTQLRAILRPACWATCRSCSP